MSQSKEIMGQLPGRRDLSLQDNPVLDLQVVDSPVQTFILNQLSEGTKKTYLSDLRGFGRWMGKELREITLGDLVCYRSYLEARGLSASTVRKKLVVLRSFFKFLKSQGIVPFNPAEEVKLPQLIGGRKREVLSLLEVEKVLAQPNRSRLLGKRDYAILGLLLVNGLRECEIVRAKVGDIVKDNGWVILNVKGKGHKEGLAKIRPDVYQAIASYLEAHGEVRPDDPLFMGTNGRSGERLSTRSIIARLDLYFRAAGVKREGLSGHSLRHTATTQTMRNGASPIKVMEMARHRSLDTTMRYFHEDDWLSNNAVDLNPIHL
ncbi:MAG: Tyrosine recombinase XerD [Syntrophomonadaceae bacterium]|nr:Tyrosine recombinase XerD [Bacillota bacterium]